MELKAQGKDKATYERDSKSIYNFWLKNKLNKNIESKVAV